jgi:hypothetical protein
MAIRSKGASSSPTCPITEPGQPTPPGFIRTLVEAQSAASDDATRYILNSVFVTSTHVVATNGRQLYASNSLALKLRRLLRPPWIPRLI